MSDQAPVIHIVDDDPAICDSIAFLVSSVGYSFVTYRSAHDFLAAWRPEQPGCLVADIRLPGMSGLELQRELNRRGATLGLIFVTAHGDIPMAVRAVRSGAVDFLEKPFDDQVLLDKINEALQQSLQSARRVARQAEAERKFDSLSPRERQVLALLVAAKTNKAIAVELDISVKTVEVHRHNLMEKTGAKSLADLVAWAAALEPNRSGQTQPIAAAD